VAVVATIPYTGRGESVAGTRVGVREMLPNRYAADERYDYPNAFRRSPSFSLIAAAAARGATGMSPHFDGR